MRREIRMTRGAIDALAVYAATTGQGPYDWPVRDLSGDYVGVRMPVALLDTLEEHVDVDDPAALSRWLVAAINEVDR